MADSPANKSQSSAVIGDTPHPGDPAASVPRRLSLEKSPYLRQHSSNPVNWYPWGEEAFSRAKKENRPIFLSIGYSTCHWCHVMAHESFEDPEVAALLNETFVCIKVDREERPDIDHVYMNVCQILTGGGGWPLTIFLLPDGSPFFAGTYFPKHSRFGRVGMVELIGRIREAREKNPGQLEQSGEEILAALKKVSADSPGGRPLGSATIDLAYNQLARSFDRELGGFGKAPKFPTPHNLMFLLRYGRRAQNPTATAMAEKTLLSMRRGGLCDQIGFGFHRYSVDAEWLVPHFEKMLYDQALLAYTYLEAYQATHHQEWAETARQIFTYVQRDLQSSEGCFHSAEDADTEGQEGKFYVWTEAELAGLLPESELQIAKTHLSVTSEGNFVEIGQATPPGQNVLAMTQSIEESSRRLEMKPSQFRAAWEKIRKQIFEARSRRRRPNRDEKILTDWNGLMIAALAKASWVLESPEYLAAASRTADFLLKNCRTNDGGLLHRYSEGEAGITGHLDDYAFLVWGLIELYEAGFNETYLQSANELTCYTLVHFWDNENGGFFLTSNDGEKLLIRPKEIYDGATPSGNSVMALNLLRMARMTGDSSLEAKADSLFKAFAQKVSAAPMVHSFLMAALDFGIGPSFEAVITGPPEMQETKALIDAVRREYLPSKILILKDPANDARLVKIAPFTRDLQQHDGKPTAYLCTDFQCAQPATDPVTLAEYLQTLTRPGKK